VNHSVGHKLTDCGEWRPRLIEDSAGHSVLDDFVAAVLSDPRNCVLDDRSDRPLNVASSRTRTLPTERPAGISAARTDTAGRYCCGYSPSAMSLLVSFCPFVSFNVPVGRVAGHFRSWHLSTRPAESKPIRAQEVARLGALGERADQDMLDDVGFNTTPGGAENFLVDIPPVRGGNTRDFPLLGRSMGDERRLSPYGRVWVS
jgi:hypothetical protein